MDSPKTGNKDEFIRIRADEELKHALFAAAEKSCRKEADQARFILRVALGLDTNEDEAVRSRLSKSFKDASKPSYGDVKKRASR